MCLIIDSFQFNIASGSAMSLIIVALTVAGVLYALYGILIALAGIRNRPALKIAATQRRFAVLIPAHNEAEVIGPLLNSLEGQGYPRSDFDVYVSCDHCTDATVSVARAHGAVVLERFGQTQRGKTWNLRWALGQIPLEDYEGVAVIDADNLVHPNFLSAMNAYLEQHPQTQAVQGVLDVKNPNDNWVTAASAMSYWFTNRFVQYAKSSLGLSCMLGGTGMMIRSACLRRIGWRLESLVDDLELTVLLNLEGNSVGWNEHAIIYDEKPTELSVSLRQRQRWMQGHFWVLARYAPALLGCFVRTRRLLYLDTLLVLVGPAITLIGLLAAIGQFAQFGRAWLESTLINETTMVAWLVSPLLIGALHAVVGPSMRAGKLSFKYLIWLPAYIAFGLTWFYPIVRGLLNARDQGHWVKTAHNRSISSSELR